MSQLKVTQVRSTIGTKPKHRGTLRALGLGRIGRTHTLPDRPEIRGMIARVPHLVTVEEVAEQVSWLRTFVAAGIIFVIALTGMAVGVIFSNRRIKGSCGGLSNMPGQEGSACDLCENPAEECQQEIADGKREPGDCPDGVCELEHFEV